MRCAKYENNKRSCLNAKRGLETVTMTTNDKVKGRKNDPGSPRSCHEQSTSGHSTPIAKKRSTNIVTEESINLDYSPSPLLLPCTQEGNNEVAWDWQSSQSRTPENRKKQRNVHCETPKGTKLQRNLQRKRNSNSPLLYKPLKRKTIKMENIENIGQFAAELQALSEKIVIKQNDKSHLSDCIKEDKAPILTDTNSIKILEVKNNKQNSVEESSNDNMWNSETNDRNDASKKETSGGYDDLFDDSVDDDMIRCTQEMEEKISLMDKESSTHLQMKKEESCTSDIPSETSVQFNSSENCRKPLGRSVLHTSDNNTLRTYSKLPLKQDASSGIHAVAQRSKDPYKPYLNNNNTIHSSVKKPCDNKKLSKSNTADFLDDSFDDWLATCVEDKKLPESDKSLTRKDDSMKFQANYKRLTNAPLKSEAKSVDSLKPMVKPETPNVGLENRKFFKTKSLSDQYINRDPSTISRYPTTRPMLQHSNSSRGPISRPMNAARTLVSTKPIVINDCKVENNAISLMHGMDRTRGSDVDRYTVKSDGDRFVKHHSTGNMKNSIPNIPKMTNTSSQPTRCTAEEIERKRLQAVAKRKLYFMKITNNINR